MVRKFQIPAGTLFLIPLTGEGTQREKEKSAISSLAADHIGEGVQIRYRSNGRPYLEGDSRHISITHTTAWGALLVSDTPCGVDIESTARDASKVVRRIGGESEIRLAKAVYPANPELLVWCAKEAAYKAAARRRDIDFLKEIKIVSGENHTLTLSVVSETVEAGFFETEGLLIVFGKSNF